MAGTVLPALYNRLERLVWRTSIHLSAYVTSGFARVRTCRKVLLSLVLSSLFIFRLSRLRLYPNAVQQRAVANRFARKIVDFLKLFCAAHSWRLNAGGWAAIDHRC